MIQLSNIGPPVRSRLASGSNPVIPRHQLRRSSEGAERRACRQTHQRAAAAPSVVRRWRYSAPRSKSTSSRSAAGVRKPKIAATTRGRSAAGRTVLHCRSEQLFSPPVYGCAGGNVSVYLEPRNGGRSTIREEPWPSRRSERGKRSEHPSPPTRRHGPEPPNLERSHGLRTPLQRPVSR